MMQNEDFYRLLDPYVSQVFFETFNAGVDMVPQFFDIRPASSEQEKIDGLVGLGQFVKGDGPLTYAETVKAYQKVFTHEVRKLGLKLPREAMDDANATGNLNNIKSKAFGLARSARNTRQADAASVFNDAFAGAINTTPDGLSLCNSAHTSNGSQANQSNTSSMALSVANVEIARLAMRNFKTDDGEPADVVPNILLTGTALSGQAKVICDSIGKSGTANNDINIYNGSIMPVEWNRLTDPAAWFLIDGELMKMFLIWYERVAVEFSETGDFDGEYKKYKGYMRYSFGPADWRWIYGSAGA